MALSETEPVRSLICRFFRPGLPFCPHWQGDFLYSLAFRNQCRDVLEVGFATGSTALYLLAGTANTGEVTSIDYKQSDFDYLGCKVVNASPWAHRHLLLEGNSNEILPDLYRQRRMFDLVFLDGWKTFDHLAVDVYYCSRMLSVGGFMVFDDTRMPAVRKIISLLLTHYQYYEVDYRRYYEDIHTRLWFVASTRSLLRPYCAFQKTRRECDLPVTRQYDFWHRF